MAVASMLKSASKNYESRVSAHILHQTTSIHVLLYCLLHVFTRPCPPPPVSVQRPSRLRWTMSTLVAQSLNIYCGQCSCMRFRNVHKNIGRAKGALSLLYNNTAPFECQLIPRLCILHNRAVCTSIFNFSLPLLPLFSHDKICFHEGRSN